MNCLSENKHILASVLCIVLSAIVAFYLYSYTKDLLRARLDEKLTATTAVAALQFDGADITKLKQLGIKGVGTPLYQNTIKKLQAIRNTNKDIQYVYIMTQTPNKFEVQYVIDADATSIEPTTDFNEDGVIDDEDVTVPGEPYDATDAPMLQGPAFEKPTVDEEVTVDTWGSFLSAYAPIYDGENVVGTFVVDVEVSDLLRLISSTFVPFVSFVIFLLVLILGLAIYIGRIWNERVEIVKLLDKQKDELLGLVSHQLATPVSGLRWNLEMFMDGDLGPLNDQQKEEMKTMQGVVGNLSDLVSMILDVSRIQLGRMKVDKTQIDLHDFFKEMIDVLEPKAKDKKQVFTATIPDQKVMGYIDKRLSHMTIENLISNAVKYTPEGGKVTIKAEISNGVLHCSVVDTGMGIPKQDQAKIFGKLYRASNVAAVDGNGFGLYVAKGAIESQGGKIWFESEEGKGTKFFVDLPIAEPMKEGTVPPVASK